MSDRRRPCDDCPFRRDSFRGFLGGTHVNDWVNAWLRRGPFPCHKTTPTTDDGAVDVERVIANDFLGCAGAAAVRRAEDTGELTDGVFASIEEFEEHHGAANRRAMQRRAARA